MSFHDLCTYSLLRAVVYTSKKLERTRSQHTIRKDYVAAKRRTWKLDHHLVWNKGLCRCD